MSGKRYILDTNAVIALLKGNKALVDRTEQADWIGISVLSEIEFLAFPNLSGADARLFSKFLKRVDVVNLTHENKKILSRVIKIRKKYKLKLPDAIIISTAIINDCALITADNQLKQVSEVEIITFDPQALTSQHEN